MRFIAAMIGVLVCIGGWHLLGLEVTEEPVRGVVGFGLVVFGVLIINEFRPGRKVE